MDLTLNEHQVALADTLKRFAQKDYTFDARQKRLHADNHCDDQAWQTLAEIGLFALLVPEENDGLGGDATDAMVMMQTLGPALVVEPLISTAVIGAELIKAADDSELRGKLFEKLAGGELKLALAHSEPQQRYNCQDIQTTAKQEGDKWTITGKKAHVIDAPCATHILVSAKAEGGDVALFAVKKDAENMKLSSYPCHDGKLAADIEFNGTPVELGQPLIKSAAKEIEWAIANANCALIAETAGIARSLTEKTIEYLKTRKQFGVPLSSFQALQFRLADMAILAAQIEGMATCAALAIQDKDNADLEMISGAKAFICDYSKKLSQEAVQLHGGVGVTDELDVSHLFKRCITISMTYGDADYHLDRYSKSLLEQTA